MAALAGSYARVPLVITCRRALGTHQDRHPLLIPLDRIANYLSHKITVNSQAVWDDTIRRDRVDESKLALIHNAVDPTPFEVSLPFRKKVRQALRVKSGETIIIVVANLIPYKGHSDLLKAARLVLNRVSHVRFLLVGEDRGIQKDLESEAINLRLSERVKFLGQRNDIPQLLTASDISVLSSHEEGFSNVILESMAAGLPVIATCVGGNREAVLNGVTGWLVPPRNPEILAEKMIDLIESPEKAKQWGRNGIERVVNCFGEKQMVEKHLKLYGSRLRDSIVYR